MPSVPDENIHPVATGHAADIVAAHQAPQSLEFYSGWFCPFVQRSWIALEEGKLPYQYKEVNPYKKEPSYLAINPKGLVPSLIDDGKILYESSIIVEYLSDQYNLGLVPKDPYQRAKGKLVIDIVNKKIIPAFFRTLQAQEPDKQESAKEEFTAALKEFAVKLPKDDGPFYAGKDFGFVDIELVPWALRFYIIEKHRGFKLPGSEEGEVWKRFAEWVDAVGKRESVWKTRSEEQYYQQIYSRYLNNTAMSLAAQATRAGRVIP